MSLPVPPNIEKGQIALDPINGIVYYKDDNENLISTTWSWLRNDLTEVSTDDNVTISGNLTVSGTTVSVNVETVTVADNILILNSNVTGSPTENAGIEVERGTFNNVSIRWNETSDKWEISNDGSTYGAIAQVGSINLGLDTVGNYMSDVSAGTGISVSHTQGEGSTATISNAGVTSLNGSTGAITGIVTTSDSGTVTSTMIQNNTIVNADVSSSAGIQYSKLNLSGSITSEDISPLASIELSKLEPGLSGQIIVVNSGATPSYVYLSGDATISSAGVVDVSIPLNDLTNVNAATPSDDQVLSYDAITSKWIPKTFSATVSAIDEIGDVVITSAEEFQSLVYDGSNWVNKYASTVTYVRNAEATTLTTGTVVYLFGATGDHASVKRADNDSDTTSSKTVGLVAANIASSQNGPVVTRGYVDGINLSSGYTEGDILWLAEDGGFTKTKPSAPEHLVFIGVVVRATNNGIIYVATQNGYELDELHDVSIVDKASGDFLKYNGTLWVNDPINLGTDTVGNYVSDITAGTGVSVTHTPGEGSSAQIAIGQSVATSATPSFAGITLTGTTSLQQSLEKTTAGGNLTGTTSIDLLTSALYTYTSTGNFTFNFRGDGSTSLNSLMSTNQSITTVIFVDNTTARSISGINIDGSSQTIKWFGGSAPSGNANSTDVYTITIIKTGSATYTVYASQSKFA